MRWGRYRLTKLAVGAAVAACLLTNLMTLFWSWELVSGDPKMSADLLVRAVFADVAKGWKTTAYPADICRDLRSWHRLNPRALVTYLSNDDGVVLCSYPDGLEDATIPAAGEPLSWVKGALGADGRDYAAIARNLIDPAGRAAGSIVAIVPDPADVDLFSRLYVGIASTNPVWVVGYLALLPTWVYLDALYYHRRARALEWATFCALLNLVGLAIYLFWDRRIPLPPMRHQNAWGG